MKLLSTLLLACATLLGTACAQAQDDALRKTLAERLPQLGAIEEVRPGPMPGLQEVRVGTDVYYTDAEGNFLIAGQIINTKDRRNLTQERIDKLTAIDFKSLPLENAFKIVRGNGERKLAVFEDPNCGYCKRFERDLQNVNNVTVYLFLLPILGGDSFERSRNIWCAANPAQAWQDHMVRDVNNPPATCNGGDGVLQSNVAFSKKYRITGTPTLVFSDGTRVPGAIASSDVESRFAAIKN